MAEEREIDDAEPTKSHADEPRRNLQQVRNCFDAFGTHTA